MRAIFALPLFLLDSAHGQYQQYMNQYAGDYQQYMGGSHGQSPDQQGATAPNQTGGDMTGGGQGQQGGYDYQKYMKQSGGQQGQQGGFDYQKYMKQYAGGQQGQQGGQGGNHTSEKQRYMDQYAGPYEQYMHTNRSDYKHKYADRYAGPFENHNRTHDPLAPRSAANCQTEQELREWRKTQMDQIKEYVPAAYNSRPIQHVETTFSSNLARIRNQTSDAQESSEKPAEQRNGTMEKLSAPTAKKNVEKPAEKPEDKRETPEEKPASKAAKLAVQPAKTIEQPAEESAQKFVGKQLGEPIEKTETAAAQRASAETQQKPSSLDSKFTSAPAAARTAQFLSQKWVGEVAQSQLSASASPTTGFLGYLSVACFACGTLLLLVVVRLRAARRANSDEHGVTEYQVLA